MSKLFETLRVENGDISNLYLHVERVNRSCNLPFEDYVNSIYLPAIGVFKLRVDYDTDVGFLGYTLMPYTPKSIRTLKIVDCNLVSYDKKYADRSRLESLFALRSGCDDVIVIKNGHVTDTSFANIIFEDAQGAWFTSDTPLLEGTRRASLIKSGVVLVRRIMMGEVFFFSRFMTINAMLPFDLCRAFPINYIRF